jgi:hypothetical protein
MKAVDSIVRYVVPGAEEDNARNFRFYVAMAATIKLVGRKDYAPDAFGTGLNGTIDLSNVIDEAAVELVALLQMYREGKHPPTLLTIAKSREFVQFLLKGINPTVSEK